MKPVSNRLLFIVGSFLLFPRMSMGQAGKQTQAPLHITAYIELDDNATPIPLTADVISCYPQLDELVLAFFNPDKYKDSLVTLSPELSRGLDAIVRRAHDTTSHHRVKVLMSIGGAKAKHTGYLAGLISPENRDGFIRQINDFLLHHGFDGVDIDFEDKALVNANYGPFLKALKQVLKSDPVKKELTVAVGRDLFFEQHIDSSALSSVDFVNAMSYDESKDNFPRQRASREFAERDLRYWLDTVHVPQNKLNLGLPFYGYIRKRAKQFPFFAIEAMPSADPAADSLQINDQQTLLYNGTETIAYKVNLARKKNINGLMIWEITYDRNGTLLKAIEDKLKAKD